MALTERQKQNMGPVLAKQAERIIAELNGTAVSFHDDGPQTYEQAMAEECQPRVCIDEDGNEYLDF